MSGHDKFFDAWLRGVQLAGFNWFGEGGEEPPSRCVDKWDLRPRYDDIEPALGWLSSGEAAFLAALYSFYNPDVGAEMLAKLGAGSVGQLAATLDPARRQIIADLLISYAGW